MSLWIVPLLATLASSPSELADCRRHRETMTAAKAPVAGAAALHVLRCLEGAPPGGRDDQAAAAERALSTKSSGALAGDVIFLRDAFGALRSATDASTVASLYARFKPTRHGATPTRDPVRRGALGDLLELALELPGADHDAALLSLYKDMPETEAAQRVLAGKRGRPLMKHRDPSLALARARTLESFHRNPELLATLKRHVPKASEHDEQACELHYLLGKTYRKKRHYRSARKHLDVVSERCGDPWRKKARYLAARVASFQGGAGVVEVLDRFIAAYPADSLTDDVLFWKAAHLVSVGRHEEADAVYSRISEAHPDGDMVHRARFDRAYLRAQTGDPAGAIELLDEIARGAGDESPIVSDQALYWRARLTAYPRLDSWEPTSDAARRAEGVAGLVALALDRPASFYGHLARLLAQSSGAKAPAVEVATRPSGLPEDVGAGELAADPRFRDASSLVEAGYLDEAVLLLDGFDPKALDPEGRLAVAALYARAARPDRAHRVMRFSGQALPPGRPEGAALSTWTLAFPRAHVDALVPAAEGEKLPPALLIGLAREESAFEASVVSWAGAIGLCQLMPPTAKEEARLTGHKGSVELAALVEPELNAKLGAAHLSRRWRQLGHPLLAIAAYNAGPGNVKRWMKKGPMPVDAWVESIPVEQTRNYVKKVTGSWVVYSLLDADREQPVTFALDVK